MIPVKTTKGDIQRIKRNLH